MGSVSSYSYSGKGSSKSESRIHQVSAPIGQVISMLKDLDEKRQKVSEAETRLDKARNDLNNSQFKLQQKLESLDPNTRDLIRGILGQLDPDTKTDVQTKGRSL